MTKFFKKLCLILTILIIPVSLVACGKDPETPTNAPGGGGESNPTVPVAFELNEEAANKVIEDTVVVFEDAIAKLNASEVLNIDNDDANEVVAAELFGYLYNANEFKKALGTTPVKLDEVYAYRLGGADNSNYFHAYNEGNDKLYVNYLIYKAGSYKYIGYEILLNDGDIKEININYFETHKDQGRAQFYNGNLNFETSTFEVFAGVVFEYTRTYLETNLTVENIDDVSWGYTYYDKFVFGDEASYEHNYDKPKSLQMINDNIENLDLLKVFEVYDEYNALQDAEVDVILETNYIGNIETSGGVSYRYRDNKIEKCI